MNQAADMKRKKREGEEEGERLRKDFLSREDRVKESEEERHLHHVLSFIWLSFASFFFSSTKIRTTDMSRSKVRVWLTSHVSGIRDLLWDFRVTGLRLLLFFPSFPSISICRWCDNRLHVHCNILWSFTDRQKRVQVEGILRWKREERRMTNDQLGSLPSSSFPSYRFSWFIMMRSWDPVDRIARRELSEWDMRKKCKREREMKEFLCGLCVCLTVGDKVNHWDIFWMEGEQILVPSSHLSVSFFPSSLFLLPFVPSSPFDMSASVLSERSDTQTVTLALTQTLLPWNERQNQIFQLFDFASRPFDSFPFLPSLTFVHVLYIRNAHENDLTTWGSWETSET